MRNLCIDTLVAQFVERRDKVMWISSMGCTKYPLIYPVLDKLCYGTSILHFTLESFKIEYVTTLYCR